MIYLLRHGETLPRPGTPSEGDVVGLTERGRRQVRRQALWLKGKGISKLVSSPLIRARQSAEVASEILAVPVEVDDRAREFVPADIPSPKYKQARDRARIEWDAVAGPGGESFNASVARFRSLLDSVPEGTLIVTHGLLLENFFAESGALIPAPLSLCALFSIERERESWKMVHYRGGHGLLDRIRVRLLR